MCNNYAKSGAKVMYNFRTNVQFFLKNVLVYDFFFIPLPPINVNEDVFWWIKSNINCLKIESYGRRS